LRQDYRLRIDFEDTKIGRHIVAALAEMRRADACFVDWNGLALPLSWAQGRKSSELQGDFLRFEKMIVLEISVPAGREHLDEMKFEWLEDSVMIEWAAGLGTPLKVSSHFRSFRVKLHHKG
jgi:hypothetical protein